MLVESSNPHITAPVSQDSLPPGDWPEQGRWSVAAWERLPDDGNRYEVIDGTLYAQSTPWTHHQWASGELTSRLANRLAEQTPAIGMLFPAVGVILPTGPVIPDFVYFHMRNLHILTQQRIVGVPDILIEIASPGTVAYDRREKQDAYARCGVPEYWWIDPGARTVEVLVLAEPGTYRPHALVERHATLPSPQLPGLQFPVDSIFMPRDLLATLPDE